MFFKKLSSRATTITASRTTGFLSNIYDCIKTVKIVCEEYTGTKKAYDAYAAKARHDPYQSDIYMDLDIEEYLMELEDEDNHTEGEFYYDIIAENDDDDKKKNDKEESSKSTATTTNQKMPDMKERIEAAEILIRELSARKRESVRELIARRAALSYTPLTHPYSP